MSKVNEIRKATRLYKYTAPRRRRRPRRRINKAITKSKTNFNIGQVVKTNHKKRISIRRMPALFPDRVVLSMVYTDVITLNTATPGQANAHIFRINSIYDPDFTGTGGQPMGHDQWGNFYEGYKVYALAYSFNCYTGNTVPSQLCVYPTDDTSLVSISIQDYISQPGCSKLCMITPDNGSCLLKGIVKPQVVLGLTKEGYSDDSLYGAAYNANPSGQCFLHLVMQPLDETSSTSVTIQVTLKYYVHLYDRKELSPS